MMDNYDVIAYIGQFCDWRTFIRLRSTCRKVRERLPIKKVPEKFKLNDDSVSKLSSLTTLYANGNPSITDASVSKLTNLKSLDACYNQSITDASISKLTNLTTLYARGTPSRTNPLITDVSISKLTNLGAELKKKCNFRLFF